jgi:hypothetical protein
MGKLKPVLATACAVAVLVCSAPAAQATATDTATTTISTSWSVSRVTLGKSATVSGVVTGGTGGARTVRLDLLLRSGWRTLTSVQTDSAGRYVIAVPTDFYRTAAMSLSAPASGSAAAGRSAQQAFAVVPAYTAAGSATSWAPFSTKARYRINPCQVVGYRVNLALAPAGALADVKGAVARVHQASGITFRYLGTTTALPPSTSGWPTGTTLVIGWARPAQTAWKMSGTLLGFGGPATWISADDAAGPVRRVNHGGVLLDSTETVGSGFTGTNRRGKLLMHEIGHAVGLGHVAATSQRMNHVIDRTSTSNWGAGDLRGMNRLGIAGGCVIDRG